MRRDNWKPCNHGQKGNNQIFRTLDLAVFEFCLYPLSNSRSPCESISIDVRANVAPLHLPRSHRAVAK